MIIFSLFSPGLCLFVTILVIHAANWRMDPR